MAFQVSPGVNVSEVDITAVIPAVSTTAAGFAGHFRWGPVSEVVNVTGEDALLSTFAKPTTSNTAVDFLIAASFLAYSNQLFTVRVINESGSTNQAKNSSGIANSTNITITSRDNYDTNYGTTGITGYGDWVAKWPGDLGNSLKISVCPSSSAWESTLSGNVSITSNTSTVTGVGTNFTSQVSVGDLIVLGPDRVSIRVSAVTNATSLTLSSTYTSNTVTNAVSPTRRWEYWNSLDRAPGTSAYTTTAGGSSDQLHVVVVDEDGEWTGIRNTVIEKFENVSFASDAKREDGSSNYYTNVINDTSKYIWWAKHNVSNANAGGTAGSAFTGATKPQTVSLVGGRDGATPRAADYITGYNKFRNSEETDVSFIIAGAQGQTLVTHLINSIAEVRKDCLVVFSPERSNVVDNASYLGKQAEDTVTYRDLLPTSTYAVMDGNWKYVYDRYSDVYRYIPCNGDTAGVMVRTDEVRDPWFSPAGVQRGQFKGVIKLAYNPTKAERDILYKNGVNPVVTLPGQGTLLFGDKTLTSTPSSFDRINVRRLFIVLEKAISTASQSTLFELNDDFTRAQFRNVVEPFLREVQGRRGIVDFRVVCDETNNTGEVIDRNEFVGDIFVKPSRSINFIQLNFVAVRTGVAFTEIVGRELN